MRVSLGRAYERVPSFGLGRSLPGSVIGQGIPPRNPVHRVSGEGSEGPYHQWDLAFYLQRSPSQNLHGLILLDYGDRDNYVCEDADHEGPEPSFTTVAPPSPPDSRSP